MSNLSQIKHKLIFELLKNIMRSKNADEMHLTNKTVTS